LFKDTFKLDGSIANVILATSGPISGSLKNLQLHFLAMAFDFVLENQHSGHYSLCCIVWSWSRLIILSIPCRFLGAADYWSRVGQVRRLFQTFRPFRLCRSHFRPRTQNMIPSTLVSSVKFSAFCNRMVLELKKSYFVVGPVSGSRFLGSGRCNPSDKKILV
jgi:hypothetical protein